MIPLKVVRLADTSLAEAGEVLARSFFDDPLWTWIEPDDERRRQMLPWFMTMSTRYGQLLGEQYTTQGPVMGVATWAPPGVTDDLDPDGTRTGFNQAPARMGEEALRRFAAMLEHQAAARRQAMPQPFWYLPTLGVDPPCQRQGVGSALLAPVLQRADADGLSCYLETEKARNVAFYEKHGFQVVVEDVNPGGGPPWWGMRRLPAV